MDGPAAPSASPASAGEPPPPQLAGDGERPRASVSRQPLVEPVLLSARRTLLFGGALLAVAALPLFAYLTPVRAGAWLALAGGWVLALSFAAALVGATRVGRGRTGTRTVALQRLLSPAVVLLGGSGLLVSGGLSVLVGDMAVRAEARAAASELATLGARLLAVQPAERVLPLVSPFGVQAELLPPVAEAGEGEQGVGPRGVRPSEESCRRDRLALPCAAEPVPDKGLLVIRMPPRPLAPYLGRLLMKSGVVLLALLALGAILARGAARNLERAAESLARPEATVAKVPEEVAGALLARRRAERSSRRASTETHPPDLLRRVGTELRAPVAEIDAQAGQLLGSGSLSPAQREDVTLIRTAAGDLAEMLDAVLELSSLASSRAPLEQASVDLAALVSDVARGLRPQVENRGLALAVEAAPDLPSVHGDARRLRQVVTNLVGNAVKFSDQGTVRVTLAREGEAVVMAVRDQGRGIADEALPLLFHPFEQAAEGRERAGGSGLGLAICKRIVEAHGGAISVESRLGEGSVFKVTLPLRVDAARAARGGG